MLMKITGHDENGSLLRGSPTSCAWCEGRPTHHWTVSGREWACETCIRREQPYNLPEPGGWEPFQAPQEELPVEERRSLGWPKLKDVACRCVHPCHHKPSPPKPEPQPIPCRCAFWCHHKEEKAAAQRKARNRVDLGRYIVNGRTDRFSSRLLGMRCEAWKTYNPENKR